MLPTVCSYIFILMNPGPVAASGPLTDTPMPLSCTKMMALSLGLNVQWKVES